MSDTFSRGRLLLVLSLGILVPLVSVFWSTSERMQDQAQLMSSDPTCALQQRLYCPSCAAEGKTCQLMEGPFCLRCQSSRVLTGVPEVPVSAQSSSRPALTCGNSVIDPFETCDEGEGNTVPGTPGGTCLCDKRDPNCPVPAGMTWSAACSYPHCGDGIPNNYITFHGAMLNADLIEEQCDDGNTQDGDGCSATCKVEIAATDTPPPVVAQTPVCGNGRTELGEVCDDGNTLSGDTCSHDCLRVELVTACGNGIIDASESCDDGNVRGGDGCSAVCKIEVVVQEPAQPRPTPTASVTLPALCGNGMLEEPEECDDGNQRSNDGCSFLCKMDEVQKPAAAVHSSSQASSFAPPSLPTMTTLPLTPSITEVATGHAPAGKTGPAAVVVMVLGAAMGGAWMRSKKRK
jgi:cysteine-rich repeat protein